MNTKSLLVNNYVLTLIGICTFLKTLMIAPKQQFK